MKEGNSTYAFFLDVKKVHDTVSRDGLWFKMWEMGIKGKLWRVVRPLYINKRSCIFWMVNLLIFCNRLGGCSRLYFITWIAFNLY